MTGIDKQRHFIRAMCKSADAESATQDERLLLEAILAALLRGQDVSDLIGTRRSHARRPSDPMRIAIHYLCLTKLMHLKPVVAWRTVGDAWGLKKREVQKIIALVNERAADYADYGWSDAGPEYGFIRGFGHFISDTLPEAHDRDAGAHQGPATRADAEVPESVPLVPAGCARGRPDLLPVPG